MAIQKPKEYRRELAIQPLASGPLDGGEVAGGRSGYDITNPAYRGVGMGLPNEVYQSQRYAVYDALMSNPDIDAISRDELLVNFKTYEDGSFKSSAHSGTLSNSQLAAGIAKAAEGKGLYGIRKRLQAYNEVIAANPGRGATVTSLKAAPQRAADPLVG